MTKATDNPRGGGGSFLFFFFEPSATVLERVSTCNLQLATCRPDPLGIGVAFEESGLV